MQNYSFRDHHLLQLLEGYLADTRPLDVAISHYFRTHKALGSKDRYEIAEAAYGMIRWRGLLDALMPNGTWFDKLHLWRREPWHTAANLPPHIAVSFPEELYNHLCSAYGNATARKLCLTSNAPAPTCIRVNTLKSSRDALLERWRDSYSVTPTSTSPDGILFEKKVHFYSMEEFRQGLFEIQDEGSQLAAALVAAEPGQRVLDYCGGAGGKALAIAPRLCGRGQLLLHDVRAHALGEARIRCRRAGIQNAQFFAAESPQLAAWKKKIDWVLVDVPCSGTGTLRRNPDMKWRFDAAMLTRLVGQQRTIFEKALSYLKSNGHIVYTTCSLLPEENERQIEHFQRTYDLTVYGQPLHTLPKPGGMDGFFGIVLTRT